MASFAKKCQTFQWIWWETLTWWTLCLSRTFNLWFIWLLSKLLVVSFKDLSLLRFLSHLELNLSKCCNRVYMYQHLIQLTSHQCLGHFCWFMVWTEFSASPLLIIKLLKRWRWWHQEPTWWVVVVDQVDNRRTINNYSKLKKTTMISSITSLESTMLRRPFCKSSIDHNL